MKKLINAFLAIVLMALVLVSCKEEPEVTISHFTISQERCLDQLNGSSYLDATNLSWEIGDQALVFGSNEDVAKFSITPDLSNYESAEMDFAEGHLGSAPYKAIYPASIATSSNTIELPAIQTTEDGRLAFLPMYGETATDQLQFKNLCGVLKVHLQQENTNISSIVVIADNVCGNFSIANAPDSPTAVYSSNGGHVITLDCTTDQSIEGDGHDFYICLPEGTYSTMELKIVNNEGGIYTYNGQSVKIDRSKYTTLAISDMTFEIPQVEIVEGRLPGLFSIKENKQIYFSMGNLQFETKAVDYVGNTAIRDFGSWYFAEHQTDIIGADNAKVFRFVDKDSTYYIMGDTTLIINRHDTIGDSIVKITDTIDTTMEIMQRTHVYRIPGNIRLDVFGWGASGYDNKLPFMTSVIDSIYGNHGDSRTATIKNSDYDWGHNNAIVNADNKRGRWRTLGRVEWLYLLYERSNAANLRGTGTVAGVHGMILLPDVWILPAGLRFNPGVGLSAADWNHNVYSTAQWKQMEAAGAVFLPAAGYRAAPSQQMCDINDIGAYWSSSNIKINNSDTYSRDYAYYVYFDPAGIGSYEYINRSRGCSVRLVKDAQ